MHALPSQTNVPSSGGKLALLSGPQHVRGLLTHLDLTSKAPMLKRRWNFNCCPLSRPSHGEAC